MPFNKYAFLTTHNSYAIEGKPLHVATQEDSITEQLNVSINSLTHNQFIMFLNF